MATSVSWNRSGLSVSPLSYRRCRLRRGVDAVYSFHHHRPAVLDAGHDPIGPAGSPQVGQDLRNLVFVFLDGRVEQFLAVLVQFDVEPVVFANNIQGGLRYLDFFGTISRLVEAGINRKFPPEP